MISTVLTAAGILSLVAVWSSVLRALVPRLTPPVTARWSVRGVFLAVTPFARRLASRPRERVMTMVAPLGLLAMLVWWLFCHWLGFVLVAVGLTGMHTDLASLGRFFALENTGGRQAVGLVCWLFTIVLIGMFVVYLTVVMNAYHRRELQAVRLSAQAQRQPDAERILAAYGRSSSRSRLDTLFADWTGWLADIRTSHLNHPALVYLRPSSELCWMQAAVIMLDAAALLEAIAPSWAMPYTQTLLDTGIRCFEQLSADLGIEHTTSAVSLQGREQYSFDDTTKITASAGLPVERSAEDTWRVFQALRTRYAPNETAIALLLLHNVVSAVPADTAVHGGKT
ncbi:MAG TPA: hypothetical protein VGL06_22610 [Pseudonocardiaceae bacterium]